VGLPDSAQGSARTRFSTLRWICLQNDLRQAGVDPATLTRVADKPGSCAFAIYHGETVTSLDIAADNLNLKLY
jgi:hypothetical protein